MKIIKEDKNVTPDQTTKTKAQYKREINRILAQYSGYHKPSEIAEMWDRLYKEYGIEVMIMGYPKRVAEDGGKYWEVNTDYGTLVYSVYEPETGERNDYNIYIG